MGRLSAFELAFTFLPILSLILGIVQVSVQPSVQQSGNHVVLRQWPPAPIFGSDELASVPANLVRSVTDSLLASGAIAIVASVFGVLQAIETFYPGSLPKAWHTLYRAILYPSIVVILAIFIYACVEESGSPKWRYTDVWSSDGTYGPESWNCQIKPYFSERSSTCNSARAGRWLSLPILGCLFALASIDLWFRPQASSKRASKGYIPS